MIDVRPRESPPAKIEKISSTACSDISRPSPGASRCRYRKRDAGVGRCTIAAGAPFLHRIESLPEKIDPTRYPFTIRAFARGIDLTFRSKVTFFVWENGAGKSTLLEAVAECCGFNPEGGSRDRHRATLADRSPLAQALLDEPEAALSPQRQLSFLKIVLNSPERVFKHLFGSSGEDHADRDDQTEPREPDADRNG